MIEEENKEKLLSNEDDLVRHSPSSHSLVLYRHPLSPPLIKWRLEPLQRPPSPTLVRSNPWQQLRQVRRRLHATQNKWPTPTMSSLLPIQGAVTKRQPTFLTRPETYSAGSKSRVCVPMATFSTFSTQTTASGATE